MPTNLQSRTLPAILERRWQSSSGHQGQLVCVPVANNPPNNSPSPFPTFILGRPKGIAHSHPSFINHYGAFNRFFKVSGKYSEKIYNPGPLFIYFLKNDGSVLVTNAFYHAGNFTNAIQCLLHGDEVHHTFGLNGDGNTIELVFNTSLRIKPYMASEKSFAFQGRRKTMDNSSDFHGSFSLRLPGRVSHVRELSSGATGQH